MKYPYSSSYQPPFPSTIVVIRNDEAGLSTQSVPALLDSGADATMVPIDLLQHIVAPPVVNTRIRSHWGEWRAVQLFMVDIEVGSLRLPNNFVVGDDEGDEVILGRNVLNKLCLILDGPKRMTEIPRQ